MPFDPDARYAARHPIAPLTPAQMLRHDFLDCIHGPPTSPPSPAVACPARRRGRRVASRYLTESWLAAQVRTWPAAMLADLQRAVTRAGYPAATLDEDLARPLLALGELPFYRLDLYRHWLLVAGGPDLLAELRRHSAHLDTPLSADVA